MPWYDEHPKIVDVDYHPTSSGPGVTRPLPFGGSKRGGWAWYQYLLLPFASVMFLVYLIFPQLGKWAALKIFLTFMVIWIGWGIFTVSFDSASGSGGNLYYSSGMYMKIIRGSQTECMDSWHLGGAPLGGPYLHVVGCSAWIGYSMLNSVGLHRQAHWLALQKSITYGEFFLQGRFSISYIWLGLALFAEIIISPAWLLYMVGRALFGHLHISWR